jgi:hypothetical protein
MILLSGPAIARLLFTNRMNVNRRIRAGAFGPIVHRGHIAYASLDGIERHAGVTFTPQQIDKAIDGRPDRLLVVPEQSEKEVA